MISKFLGIFFLFGFLFVPAIAHETEVSKRMHKIEGELKLMRREIRKGDLERSLSRLENIVTWTKEAQSLTPGSVKFVPAGQRASFLAGYRREMSLVLTKYKRLGEALRLGEQGQASEILKGLFDHKREAHRTYNKLPDDHLIKLPAR